MDKPSNPAAVSRWGPRHVILELSIEKWAVCALCTQRTPEDVRLDPLYRQRWAAHVRNLMEQHRRVMDAASESNSRRQPDRER